MFGPNIPEIQEGDEIGASWLGLIRKGVMLALGLRVEAPLELVDLHGVRILRLAATTGGTRAGGWIGRSGPDGIPAMIDLTPGSATVLIYSFATDDLVEDGEDTAYHTGPEPVAGDVVIQGKFVDGKRVVDWESCPVAGA